MAKRRALWLLPAVLAGGLFALAASALAVRPLDSHLAYAVAGLADRNLDQFAVTAGPDGYVTVDVAQIIPGALAPVSVLRTYVEDLNSGQKDAAWAWIHPTRQTAEAHARFLAAAPPGSGIREYRTETQRLLPTWDDRLKTAGLPGGRTWTSVMELGVTWTDSGAHQVIHVVQDDQDAWRLLWSPAFALE